MRLSNSKCMSLIIICYVILCYFSRCQGGKFSYWGILGMCGQNGSFSGGQKPVNGCKFLPKNLQMGHIFST